MSNPIKRTILLFIILILLFTIDISWGLKIALFIVIRFGYTFLPRLTKISNMYSAFVLCILLFIVWVLVSITSSPSNSLQKDFTGFETKYYNITAEQGNVEGFLKLHVPEGETYLMASYTIKIKDNLPDNYKKKPGSNEPDGFSAVEYTYGNALVRDEGPEEFGLLSPIYCNKDVPPQDELSFFNETYGFLVCNEQGTAGRQYTDTFMASFSVNVNDPEKPLEWDEFQIYDASDYYEQYESSSPGQSYTVNYAAAVNDGSPVRSYDLIFTE